MSVEEDGRCYVEWKMCTGWWNFPLFLYLSRRNADPKPRGAVRMQANTQQRDGDATEWEKRVHWVKQRQMGGWWGGRRRPFRGEESGGEGVILRLTKQWNICVFCAYEYISIGGKWMDDLGKYQRRSMIIADLHLHISLRASHQKSRSTWKMLSVSGKCCGRLISRPLGPVSCYLRKKPSKGKWKLASSIPLGGDRDTKSW